MNGIKAARKAKCYTQSEVASAVGVNVSSVSMWETGKALPRVDKLIKLAALLECSIEQLLRGKV